MTMEPGEPEVPQAPLIIRSRGCYMKFFPLHFLLQGHDITMIRQRLIRPAALLGAFFLASGLFQDAFAQGQQQFGQPPNTHLTWAASPVPNATGVDVTYFIGAGFSVAQQTAIRNSASVWTNANGGVRLVEVGSAVGAGMQVVNANFGGNVIGDYTLATVAGAGTFPDGNPWNRIISATLFIDSTPPFPWATGPVGPGDLDFTAVMIDLFGLGLGLGFAGTGDPNSVMRNTFGLGPQNQTLSSQDVGALSSLYGAPEPATWTLFGVGLLAMGAIKRFRKNAGKRA
jgi:hypothetical protein